MPKWLQGMVLPTLMLWVYALALGLASAATPNGTLPWAADYLSRASLALIIAHWVNADAQKRNWPLCYDYGSFVYFAWPIVVPIYLFRTRRAGAFLTLLCFAGICLISGVVAQVILVVRAVVHP